MPNPDTYQDLVRDYFDSKNDISFCFLFGSRSKGVNRTNSDFDIGIYFKPENPRIIEFEESKEYELIDKIWTDLELLLKKEVDLIVLNNAPVQIASIIITQGIPIVIKDKKLFADFSSIVTSNAIDYREFVHDYFRIYQRSCSISEIDKTNLKKIIIFVESELNDYDTFKNLSWIDYEGNRSKRRDVERWIENLINAIIDASKILVASEKMPLPETYRELILKLKLFEIAEDDSIEKLAHWVKLRNILAHEYLDIRWNSIKEFINGSQAIITSIINKLKEKVM